MSIEQEFYEHCARKDPIYKRGRNGKYQCPVCKCFTLDEVAAYDICPVCFWEDDGTAGEHSFNPNGVTLARAQENFKAFGAVEKRSIKHVRKPRQDELEILGVV